MKPTRRSVLRAGCGVFAGGILAGCVGDSSSGGSDTDTAAGTETTPSASPTDAAVGTDTDQPTTTGRETQVPTTTPQTTETRDATTSATTPGTTAVNRGCNGARGLVFKLRNEGSVRGTQQSVSVGGFSLGAGAHVFLVAYEGDTVLGTAESSAPGVQIVVDGISVPLDEPLTGEHTIRVVMYPAPKSDSEFDAGSATPCRYEGEVIQAGPETIDFSAFTPSTSTTTS